MKWFFFTVKNEWFGCDSHPQDINIDVNEVISMELLRDIRN